MSSSGRFLSMMMIMIIMMVMTIKTIWLNISDICFSLWLFESNDDFHTNC